MSGLEESSHRVASGSLKPAGPGEMAGCSEFPPSAGQRINVGLVLVHVGSGADGDELDVKIKSTSAAWKSISRFISRPSSWLVMMMVPFHHEGVTLTDSVGGAELFLRFTSIWCRDWTSLEESRCWNIE